MQEIIINIINSLGYLGIFLLVVIENLFPPIPSEFILIFSGVFATYTNLTCLNIIFYATLGSLVGAYILYGVGFILNKDKLKKLVNSKIGKILRLKESDIDKADSYFNKNGIKTVLFCRFIPILRSLISIPAGVYKMSFIKFSIFTIIGTVIWNTVLVYLGNIIGVNWNSAVLFFKRYAEVVRICIIIFIIYGIFCLFKRKKNIRR